MIKEGTVLDSMIPSFLKLNNTVTSYVSSRAENGPWDGAPAEYILWNSAPLKALLSGKEDWWREPLLESAEFDLYHKDLKDCLHVVDGSFNAPKIPEVHVPTPPVVDLTPFKFLTGTFHAVIIYNMCTFA